MEMLVAALALAVVVVAVAVAVVARHPAWATHLNRSLGPTRAAATRRHLLVALVWGLVWAWAWA